MTLRAMPLVVLLLAAASSGMVETVAEAAPPTSLRRGDRVAIVCADELPMPAALARDDLRSYLQQALGLTLCTRSASVGLADLDEPVCIIFGTPHENTLLAGLSRIGFDAHTDKLGDEGSRVKAGVVDSKLVLALTGNTVAGAAHAVYSFLENELQIGFFIDGDRVPVLHQVSLDRLDRTEIPAVPIRGLFYHHTWKHPHANSWRLWGYDRWQKSIDWMRRKRFNMLPMIHDAGEYMWGDAIFRAFPKIPQNEKTLDQFVVDPRWRRELNKKIFDYARGSGIHVAYNLFYSQVPEFFADYFPELKFHPLNMRNVGINADQPQCREIMKRYWKEILDTYGLDDSHIYLVCSYEHERTLPAGMKNKNSTTNAAFEILKELDPKATMYIETWCWKYRDEPAKTPQTLDDNPLLEWHDFDLGVPKEVGVAEWDVRRMHPMPRGYGKRPYIQVTHTNMEGWWPPNTVRNHPQWLVNYFGEAIDQGAQGVLFFHIQANTNEIIADLVSKIGWQGRPDIPAFYRDYARRRFGAEIADPLAESQSLLCDAVDYGANPATAPFRDMMEALVPPGFTHSAEDVLAKLLAQGAERRKWIEERLELFRRRARQVGQALLLARGLATHVTEEPFLKKYLWELDYVAARHEGIENLYAAHLLAETNPAQAARHFDRALDAFFAVKELFRDQPGIRMADLRQLEPDVPFTASFLRDWETRGYWQPRVKSFHVVWERFDEFEQIIRGMRPAGLPVVD